jgi:glycosyltransferase involved in cell wall biosynthesis
MARARLGIAAEATVVLFVAQSLGNSYKGMPVLMEALQRAERIPNLLVVAVGGGALPAGFPVTCVSLGEMNEEKELALAYSASDLFVLPSLQDNFPNTALEAMACGVPVVGTRVGGIPEIVRDGCTGRLVEQGDAAALAGAIEELLTNAERRAQMAGNCRRVALEEYTLEMQTRRYVGVYESLLS